MSFLSPFLLFGLPLALLPIIIHLIHLHRRRTIEWAAMMFLLAAQRMNRGYSRLRQILILAARTIAVLGLIFLISRPLAGGWLGLTGGAPDTVLVLLDRSASMEQMNLTTGQSKRSSAVQKISQGIEEMFGKRTQVVLIDSATATPSRIDNAKALLDLPATQFTDTAADLPTMLQAALDYVTTNQIGRTDIWIASDLRASDWNAASGRWEAMRAAFAKLTAIRFHLIAYPQTSEDNISIVVEKATRRETSEKAELLLDLRISRHATNPVPLDLTIGLVVNGTRSSLPITLRDNEQIIQGHAIPIDKAMKRGWGRVELPADANARDNVFNFVFDQPSVPLTVIVSDDLDTIEPLKAVVSSPIDASRKQEVKVLPTGRTAEIDWDKTALILWQAPLPAPGDILSQQLENHVASGRSVIFFPPDRGITDTKIFGLGWGEWRAAKANVEWWRASDGLLANSRAGESLAVGELEVLRHAQILGEGSPLARLTGNDVLLMRSAGDRGNAFFCSTLPGSSASSLARDGVVFYVMLQRALADGAKTLGNAQQREVGQNQSGTGSLPVQQSGTGSLPVSSSKASERAGSPSHVYAGWKPITEGITKTDDKTLASDLALRGGVLSNGDKLMALNRPLSEDATAILPDTALNELFAGLQFRRVDDSVDNEKSLANEIWRTFLLLMALAIIAEALLCMPSKNVVSVEKDRSAGFGSVPNAA